MAEGLDQINLGYVWCERSQQCCTSDFEKEEELEHLWQRKGQSTIMILAISTTLPTLFLCQGPSALFTPENKPILAYN